MTNKQSLTVGLKELEKLRRKKKDPFTLCSEDLERFYNGNYADLAEGGELASNILNTYDIRILAAVMGARKAGTSGTIVNWMNDRIKVLRQQMNDHTRDSLIVNGQIAILQEVIDECLRR